MRRRTARKGTDVWLRSAAHVRALAPDLDVRFRWVGLPNDEYTTLSHSLGIDDIVEFVGEVPQVAPVLAGSDIFTITSRIDPSPLVVPEAMALGLPVIGTDAGGIPAQVGDAGVIVPADDPGGPRRSPSWSSCRDPGRRAELGATALERVRATLDIAQFRTSVVTTARSAAGVSGGDPPERSPGMLTYPAPPGTERPLKIVLLQAFERADLASARAGVPTLPYRAETITRTGATLRLTDAHFAPRWSRGALGSARRWAERLTTPFVQTLLARQAIASSDATIAMFESQGNAMAMLRALHIPPFTRPAFVVVSCWLTRDLQRFGRGRRLLYRFAYRSVDRIVFFSANQTDVIERQLRVPRSRLRNVHFGIDHETFRPPRPSRRGLRPRRRPRCRA